MIDLKRAGTFIQTHGTSVDRARLEALLENRFPQNVPAVLRAAQNSDGGFAFDLHAGRPSAFTTTAQSLRWLHDLRLLDSAEGCAAVRFIVDRQTLRGIWREQPSLQPFDPPPWMDPESAAADVYTTALCAGTLAVVSQDNDLQIDRAVGWLQTQQGRDGLLAGFKAHSSWLALPAFVHILGQETRATRRLVAGLGKILSSAWPASMLTWLLQALLDAGYTHHTKLVDRAWTLLANAQQADGSFAAEDDDAVETTLRAIDVARRLA
jgi:hypothetical protein